MARAHGEVNKKVVSQTESQVTLREKISRLSSQAGRPSESSRAEYVSSCPIPDATRRKSRACQIFFELKGGTVFYGTEHSRSHGHACHGETYEAGSLPDWGEGSPVHLIGHSFGGQTARVLQHLIASGEAGGGGHRLCYFGDMFSFFKGCPLR